MKRISQVLGFVLALTLGLTGSDAQARSPGLSVSFADATGQEWIEVLRDTAMPMSERLEVAVSEPSLTAWLEAVIKEVASLEPRALADAMDTFTAAGPVPEPANVFDAEFQRGVRGLTAGIALMDVEDVQGKLGEVGFGDVDLELAEVLTDPAVPMIVGDAVASYLEGMVALVAMLILRDSEPELALELATAFADRMEGTPRMLALLGLDGGLPLRDGWQACLSEADIETLDRDRAEAERYVAGLAAIADQASA